MDSKENIKYDYIIIFNSQKKVQPPKDVQLEVETIDENIPDMPTNGTFDKQQLIVLHYWKSLCKMLLSVGLEFKVKSLKDGYIALCIHCPDDILAIEYYKFRVQDYLHGVGVSNTDFEEMDIRDPAFQKEIISKLPESQRLYIIYGILTRPVWEGGVGISTEIEGSWQQTGGMYLESCFTLHDKELNEKWIKNWSKKWMLSTNDMTDICNHFGARIAYYFAFLQKYFMSLLLPSILGILVFFLDSRFSIIYGVFIVVWSMVFIVLWNRHAEQLAILWNVTNCINTEKTRPEFRPVRIIKDKATGECIPYYPNWKRWLKRICITYPFIIFCALFTVVVLTINIGIEIWFNDFYSGPFERLMTFVPTILYSVFVPGLNILYLKFARILNDFENYPTKLEYDNRFAEKVFVFYFLNSFMSLIVIGWAYIPFSVEFTEFLQLTPFGSLIKEAPNPGPERLVGSYIYFVLTGQIMNFFQETLIPFVTRKLMGIATKATTKKEKKPEESKDPLVKQIEEEMEMPVYDVNDDYAEMVVQYGYVSLFSIVWPLGSLSSFINNWIELRSDAVKMCINYRRPFPSRSDNIGPWFRMLMILSWLSSITNAWFVCVFRYWEAKEKGKAAIDFGNLVRTLSVIIICEHLYFFVKFMFETFLSDCVPGKRDHTLRKAEIDVKNKILHKVGIHKSQIDLYKLDSSPEYQLKKNTAFGIALNAIYEKFNTSNETKKTK